MEFENFDQLIPNEYRPHYKQVHFLAPVWPFRLLMTGPSGSGKSNVLMNLVTKYLYFDKLYLFCKDESEDKVKFLQDYFSIIEIKLKKDRRIPEEYKIMTVSTKLEEIPDIDKLNASQQHLFIFDDFVTEKEIKQHKIADMFVRGRKRNISTIYITQSYFKTPKIIRLNCSYFCFFNIGSRKELQSICADHCGDIDKEEFYQMYKEISKEHYSFLVIDKV